MVSFERNRQFRRTFELFFPQGQLFPEKIGNLENLTVEAFIPTVRRADIGRRPTLAPC